MAMIPTVPETQAPIDFVRRSVDSPAVWPAYVDAAAKVEPNDHFITRDGVTFAGTHLILDLYDAERLDDLALMESALREAVEASGATLLHIHLHHFEPGGGISGVAVLAESHISVHTWPERGYAAFDAFMCGATRPENTIPVLRRAFRPERLEVNELRRGQV